MNNPQLLTIATVLLWSFGPFLGRLVSLKSAVVLLSISFLFTFLTMLLFTFITHCLSLSNIVKAFSFKYLFFGLFGYFFYWFAFTQSFRAYNTGSEATVLNYTWPIFTIVFTELFFNNRNKGKKTKVIHVVESIGIFLGFLSILILATKGNVFSFNLANGIGLAWGLAAGASYGLFSAYSSTVSKEKQSIFLLYATFVSLAAMLTVSLSEAKIFATLTVNDIIIVALLGAVIDGLGYIAWTRANRVAREKNIDISSVASIVFTLPILSLVVITICLKETTLFQLYFLTSLLFVFLSSFLCQKPSFISNLFKNKRISTSDHPK
jgi:drug/metabolite transporter (DMT)-like permease